MDKTINAAIAGCGVISDIYLQNLTGRFEIIKVVGCYDKAKYAEGDPAKLQSFREGTMIRSAADPTTLRALQCWPPPRRVETFSAFDNYVYGDTDKGYYPLPIFAELSKREASK